MSNIDKYIKYKLKYINLKNKKLHDKNLKGGAKLISVLNRWWSGALSEDKMNNETGILRFGDLDHMLKDDLVIIKQLIENNEYKDCFNDYLNNYLLNVKNIKDIIKDFSGESTIYVHNNFNTIKMNPHMNLE
jgi:hypothetical protein